MSRPEPLLTILRHTFNHVQFIRKCLDGFVMQQTTFPFEAVVYDDASTDGTADIMREYAEKYPCIIKPILQTEISGLRHAMIQSIRDSIHLLTFN